MYGFVTDKRNWKTKHRLLRHLALETQVRGIHATGMAWTDGQHVGMYKLDWPAKDYVKTCEFETIADLRPNIVIGHNRYATHGDPSNNINNHPFKSRQRYFMHNGVIQNYDQLKREYPCQSECDSEVILRVIESYPRRVTGIQATYREVQGSFACALLDSRKLRLWLWRNYGNPIVMCYNTKLNLFVFGSTADIVREACRKADIQDYWKTAPMLLPDDHILKLYYRNGRILRNQYEVENKQTDPTSIRYWSNDQLDNYVKERRYNDPTTGRYRGYHDNNGELVIY